MTGERSRNYRVARNRIKILTNHTRLFRYFCWDLFEEKEASYAVRGSHTVSVRCHLIARFNSG